MMISFSLATVFLFATAFGQNQQVANLNFQLQLCKSELSQLTSRYRQAFNNYYYQVCHRLWNALAGSNQKVAATTVASHPAKECPMHHTPAAGNVHSPNIMGLQIRPIKVVQLSAAQSSQSGNCAFQLRYLAQQLSTARTAALRASLQAQYESVAAACGQPGTSLPQQTVLFPAYGRESAQFATSVH